MLPPISECSQHSRRVMHVTLSCEWFPIQESSDQDLSFLCLELNCLTSPGPFPHSHNEGMDTGPVRFLSRLAVYGWHRYLCPWSLKNKNKPSNVGPPPRPTESEPLGVGLNLNNSGVAWAESPWLWLQVPVNKTGFIHCLHSSLPLECYCVPSEYSCTAGLLNPRWRGTGELCSSPRPFLRWLCTFLGLTFLT